MTTQHRHHVSAQQKKKKKSNFKVDNPKKSSAPRIDKTDDPTHATVSCNTSITSYMTLYEVTNFNRAILYKKNCVFMLFLSINYVQLRSLRPTVHKPVNCHYIFISLVDRKNKQNACTTDTQNSKGRKKKKFKLFPITRAEMDAGSVIMIIRLWQNVVQLHKEEMCIERNNVIWVYRTHVAMCIEVLVITGDVKVRCQTISTRFPMAMAPLTRRCSDHLSFVSAGPTGRLYFSWPLKTVLYSADW